eukprot:3227242-Pyramimonas_sp.AAC.1
MRRMRRRTRKRKRRRRRRNASIINDAPTTVYFHFGISLVGRQPFEDPEAYQNIVLGFLTPRINLSAASSRSRTVPERHLWDFDTASQRNCCASYS